MVQSLLTNENDSDEILTLDRPYHRLLSCRGSVCCFPRRLIRLLCSFEDTA